MGHCYQMKQKEERPHHPSPAQTPALQALPPNRQQNNTSPALRPRRLIVRRDGSAITQTTMELRDALNKALGFVAIQSVQVSNSSAVDCTGNVSLTLMENFLATKIHAKVGRHLSTIPRACSLHLDNPIVQMVVHGIPTSLPFESLQQKLTIITQASCRLHPHDGSPNLTKKERNIPPPLRSPFLGTRPKKSQTAPDFSRIQLP
jgi:hypothetical protein